MITLAAAQLTGVAGWMTSLIDALGSVGVGAVILLETVFPPIPSEVVLPAAGYLRGTGDLNFLATLAWATGGSVVDALVLYGLGAVVGVTRLQAWAERTPLMSANDVVKATRTFARWQRKAVFFGRLVPGVRSLVSIPAGVAALGMPDRWYATTIGDVEIVALDSNQATNPDQVRWLNATLSDSTAKWSIATLHHPPYSGGSHGSSLEVRTTFSPLLEQYGRSDDA